METPQFLPETNDPKEILSIIANGTWNEVQYVPAIKFLAARIIELETRLVSLEQSRETYLQSRV